jgi:two-component system nitrogen regulation sensor histidine kinase NtrY
VNAGTAIPVESPKPRWRRRIAIARKRSGYSVPLGIAMLLILTATIAASYYVLTRAAGPGSALAPEMIAALMVANLVPAMVLMVLFARRLARRRAAQSEVGGRGRMHVRLVALFSAIAAVPTLLVVIFASLLFQSGLQFWFSDDAQTILRNAENVAQEYRSEHMTRIEQDARAMGADIVREINAVGVESPQFRDWVLIQKILRTLSEAAVISISSTGVVQSYVVVDLDDRAMEQRVSAAALTQLRAGETIVATDAGDRVQAVIRLDPEARVYLYVSRFLNPQVLRQIDEAGKAASDYQETLNRSRALQFRFHAVLFSMSLLLVAIAIWIALKLADRLVRPVGELVGAARRVAGGDLSVRVPDTKARDEIGTLGTAFNRMTSRLEEQTGDLVAANAQLDSRRAFTEAVLSGVTAGVLSVDEERVVRLINSQAEALLKTGGTSPVGQKLADLAPELDRLLMSEEREDVVQLASSGEPRTLAVKTVRVKGGHVLTFDDITEQLLDQRRAAWSDVARRIAHEIKNPLTPIQLAAERLQRRYGAEVASDPATFERLTGTIVRQVGDLRRMVDEFSSFARMPKPAFAEESLGEIARQALFLHEVAHPEIQFSLDAPDPPPALVCDRRLLGQALTNIVKNGVEAIQQKHEGGKAKRAGQPDGVAIAIREEGSKVTIEVTDTGVGLPSERARMTEPYMTTRTKGTGLGLAIVKKIVEEHFGQIEFDDGPDGGSLVRLIFDSRTLAQLGPGVRYSEDTRTNG